jgi:hypothetical protein
VLAHVFLHDVVAESHTYGEQFVVEPESEHEPEPLQRRAAMRLVPEQVEPVPHAVEELG